MYNDYPTIYETNLNQYLIFYIIFGLIVLGIFIFTLISLAKIFKKANRSSISAIIPFYNYIILLEITNLPKFYFILSLIPGVNIVFNMAVMFELAKLFRKGKSFGLGLSFLPFVFYPILAFDKSEYIGINLVAKENKSTVVELPKVFNEEENPVINESFDDKNKNINISIGGGVYQKDYTNTLLNIDEKQIIVDKSVNKNNIPENIQKSENITNKIENANSVNQESIPKVDNNINLFNPEVLEYINCPQCGAKIKKNAKTCFLCGKNIG